MSITRKPNSRNFPECSSRGATITGSYPLSRNARSKGKRNLYMLQAVFATKRSFLFFIVTVNSVIFQFNGLHGKVIPDPLFQGECSPEVFFRILQYIGHGRSQVRCIHARIQKLILIKVLLKPSHSCTYDRHGKGGGFQDRKRQAFPQRRQNKTVRLL